MNTSESTSTKVEPSCSQSGTSAKATPRAAVPQNENIVTVNVQPDSARPLCGRNGDSGSLMISPQPLRIDVQSSTDWPTVLVGSAGILSSIVIARYTSRLQTNQIKANIANLRQRWIEDLRECATRYMEKVTFIVNKMQDEKDFLRTPISVEPYSAMLSAQIKFGLMLDLQHERNRQAIELSEQIIGAIKGHSDSDKSGEIGILGRRFEDLVREILEAAWSDIKRDLLVDRWYVRLIRALAKKT